MYVDFRDIGVLPIQRLRDEGNTHLFDLDPDFDMPNKFR
jgi:hypothetical protein